MQKKFTAALLALCLCMGLAACASAPAETTSPGLAALPAETTIANDVIYEEQYFVGYDAFFDVWYNLGCLDLERLVLNSDGAWFLFDESGMEIAMGNIEMNPTDGMDLYLDGICAATVRLDEEDQLLVDFLPDSVLASLLADSHYQRESVSSPKER